jgi:hypothetical protein
MNTHLKTVAAISARSLPLVVSAVLALPHPAFAAVGAATGALAGISTGATMVESSLQYVGMIACVIGIAIGGIHWVQHRDDWFGAGSRILSGVIGGVVISNALTIATMGGGAVL